MMQMRKDWAESVSNALRDGDFRLANGCLKGADDMRLLKVEDPNKFDRMTVSWQESAKRCEDQDNKAVQRFTRRLEERLEELGKETSPRDTHKASEQPGVDCPQHNREKRNRGSRADRRRSRSGPRVADGHPSIREEEMFDVATGKKKMLALLRARLEPQQEKGSEPDAVVLGRRCKDLKTLLELEGPRSKQAHELLQTVDRLRGITVTSELEEGVLRTLSNQVVEALRVLRLSLSISKESVSESAAEWFALLSSDERCREHASHAALVCLEAGAAAADGFGAAAWPAAAWNKRKALFGAARASDATRASLALAAADAAESGKDIQRDLQREKDPIVIQACRRVLHAKALYEADTGRLDECCKVLGRLSRLPPTAEQAPLSIQSLHVLAQTLSGAPTEERETAAKEEEEEEEECFADRKKRWSGSLDSTVQMQWSKAMKAGNYQEAVKVLRPGLPSMPRNILETAVRRVCLRQRLQDAGWSELAVRDLAHDYLLEEQVVREMVNEVGGRVQWEDPETMSTLVQETTVLPVTGHPVKEEPRAQPLPTSTVQEQQKRRLADYERAVQERQDAAKKATRQRKLESAAEVVKALCLGDMWASQVAAPRLNRHVLRIGRKYGSFQLDHDEHVDEQYIDLEQRFSDERYFRDGVLRLQPQDVAAARRWCKLYPTFSLEERKEKGDKKEKYMVLQRKKTSVGTQDAAVPQGAVELVDFFEGEKIPEEALMRELPCQVVIEVPEKTQAVAEGLLRLAHESANEVTVGGTRGEGAVVRLLRELQLLAKEETDESVKAVNGEVVATFRRVPGAVNFLCKAFARGLGTPISKGAQARASVRPLKELEHIQAVTDYCDRRSVDAWERYEVEGPMVPERRVVNRPAGTSLKEAVTALNPSLAVRILQEDYSSNSPPPQAVLQDVPMVLSLLLSQGDVQGALDLFRAPVKLTADAFVDAFKSVSRDTPMVTVGTVPGLDELLERALLSGCVVAKMDVKEYLLRQLPAVLTEFLRPRDESRIVHSCRLRWKTTGWTLELPGVQPQDMPAPGEVFFLTAVPSGLQIEVQVHMRQSNSLQSNWVKVNPIHPNTKGGVRERASSDAVGPCWKVEKVMNRVTYLREIDALSQAAKCILSQTPGLAPIIVSRSIAEDAAARSEAAVPPPPRNLVEHLNESQRRAVEAAAERKLTLIQGPPGAGKTTTAVAVVKNWLLHDRSKVLVCAPTNDAVDNIALELERSGLRMHRPGNPEKIRAEVTEVSLPMQAAQVICCTCSGAAKAVEKLGCPPKRVIIDEAAKSTEASTLIPLLSGCKQAVLVGDHAQLAPCVLSRGAEEAGLRESLFLRTAQCATHALQEAQNQRKMEMRNTLDQREGSSRSSVQAAELLQRSLLQLAYYPLLPFPGGRKRKEGESYACVQKVQGGRVQLCTVDGQEFVVDAQGLRVADEVDDPRQVARKTRRVRAWDLVLLKVSGRRALVECIYTNAEREAKEIQDEIPRMTELRHSSELTQSAGSGFDLDALDASLPVPFVDGFGASGIDEPFANTFASGVSKASAASQEDARLIPHFASAGDAIDVTFEESPAEKVEAVESLRRAILEEEAEGWVWSFEEAIAKFEEAKRLRKTETGMLTNAKACTKRAEKARDIADRREHEVPLLLDVQHRMAPVLAEFSSKRFYNGKLRSAELNRPPVLGLPGNKPHLVLVDMPAADDEAHEWENDAEADHALDIVAQVRRKNRDLSVQDVTVLTIYKRQCALIQKKAQEREVGVDCATADGFQGQERAVIVVSLARAGTAVTDFMKDPRRINVLLTRAKRAVVVVGCCATLRGSFGAVSGGEWTQYVLWCEQRGLLVRHLPRKRPARSPREVAEKSSRSSFLEAAEAETLCSVSVPVVLAAAAAASGVLDAGQMVGSVVSAVFAAVVAVHAAEKTRTTRQEREMLRQKALDELTRRLSAEAVSPPVRESWGSALVAQKPADTAAAPLAAPRQAAQHAEYEQPIQPPQLQSSCTLSPPPCEHVYGARSDPPIGGEVTVDPRWELEMLRQAHENLQQRVLELEQSQQFLTQELARERAQHDLTTSHLVMLRSETIPSAIPFAAPLEPDFVRQLATGVVSDSDGPEHKKKKRARGCRAGKNRKTQTHRTHANHPSHAQSSDEHVHGMAH